MYSWNREIIDNYYRNKLDSVTCDLLKWTYRVDNEQESSLSDRQGLEKNASNWWNKIGNEYFISSMVGTKYGSVHDLIMETQGGYGVCLYTCLEVVGRELEELKANKMAECESSTNGECLVIDHNGRSLVLVRLKDVLEELSRLGDNDTKVVLICSDGVLTVHSHKRGD